MFSFGQLQWSSPRGQHVLQEYEASEHREDEHTHQIFGMGTGAAPAGCVGHREGN